MSHKVPKIKINKPSSTKGKKGNVAFTPPSGSPLEAILTRKQASGPTQLDYVFSNMQFNNPANYGKQDLFTISPFTSPQAKDAIFQDALRAIANGEEPEYPIIGIDGKPLTKERAFAAYKGDGKFATSFDWGSAEKEDMYQRRVRASKELFTNTYDAMIDAGVFDSEAFILAADNVEANGLLRPKRANMVNKDEAENGIGNILDKESNLYFPQKRVDDISTVSDEDGDDFILNQIIPIGIPDNAATNDFAIRMGGKRTLTGFELKIAPDGTIGYQERLLNSTAVADVLDGKAQFASEAITQGSTPWRDFGTSFVNTLAGIIPDVAMLFGNDNVIENTVKGDVLNLTAGSKSSDLTYNPGMFNSAAAVASTIGNVTGSLVSFMGYGSISNLSLKALMVPVKAGARKLATRKLTKTIAEKYATKNLTQEAIAKVAERASHIINFVEKASAAIGKVPVLGTHFATTEGIAMTAVGMGLNGGEGMRAALDSGLSEEDARAVGIVYGAVATAIEGLDGGAFEKMLLGAKPKHVIANSIINSYAKNGSKILTDSNLFNTTVRTALDAGQKVAVFGKGIGTEMVEEGSQFASQEVVNRFYNFFNASGKRDIKLEDDFWMQLGNNALAGATGGGLGGAIINPIMQKIQGANKYGGTALIKAIADRKEGTVREAIDWAADKAKIGKLTQEQHDHIIKDIDRLVELRETNKQAFNFLYASSTNKQLKLNSSQISKAGEVLLTRLSDFDNSFSKFQDSVNTYVNQLQEWKDNNKEAVLGDNIGVPPVNLVAIDEIVSALGELINPIVELGDNKDSKLLSLGVLSNALLERLQKIDPKIGNVLIPILKSQKEGFDKLVDAFNQKGGNSIQQLLNSQELEDLSGEPLLDAVAAALHADHALMRATAYIHNLQSDEGLTQSAVEALKASKDVEKTRAEIREAIKQGTVDKDSDLMLYGLESINGDEREMFTNYIDYLADVIIQDRQQTSKLKEYTEKLKEIVEKVKKDKLTPTPKDITHDTTTGDEKGLKYGTKEADTEGILQIVEKVQKAEQFKQGELLLNSNNAKVNAQYIKLETGDNIAILANGEIVTHVPIKRNEDGTITQESSLELIDTLEDTLEAAYELPKKDDTPDIEATLRSIQIVRDIVVGGRIGNFAYKNLQLPGSTINFLILSDTGDGGLTARNGRYYLQISRDHGDMERLLLDPEDGLTIGRVVKYLDNLAEELQAQSFTEIDAKEDSPTSTTEEVEEVEEATAADKDTSDKIDAKAEDTLDKPSQDLAEEPADKKIKEQEERKSDLPSQHDGTVTGYESRGESAAGENRAYVKGDLYYEKTESDKTSNRILGDIIYFTDSDFAEGTMSVSDNYANVRDSHFNNRRKAATLFSKYKDLTDAQKEFVISYLPLKYTKQTEEGVVYVYLSDDTQKTKLNRSQYQNRKQIIEAMAANDGTTVMPKASVLRITNGINHVYDNRSDKSVVPLKDSNPFHIVKVGDRYYIKQLDGTTTPVRFGATHTKKGTGKVNNEGSLAGVDVATGGSLGATVLVLPQEGSNTAIELHMRKIGELATPLAKLIYHAAVTEDESALEFISMLIELSDDAKAKKGANKWVYVKKHRISYKDGNMTKTINAGVFEVGTKEHELALYKIQALAEWLMHIVGNFAMSEQFANGSYVFSEEFAEHINSLTNGMFVLKAGQSLEDFYIDNQIVGTDVSDHIAKEPALLFASDRIYEKAESKTKKNKKNKKPKTLGTALPKDLTFTIETLETEYLESIWDVVPEGSTFKFVFHANGISTTTTLIKDEVIFDKSRLQIPEGTTDFTITVTAFDEIPQDTSVEEQYNTPENDSNADVLVVSDQPNKALLVGHDSEATDADAAVLADTINRLKQTLKLLEEKGIDNELNLDLYQRITNKINQLQSETTSSSSAPAQGPTVEPSGKYSYNAILDGNPVVINVIDGVHFHLGKEVDTADLTLTRATTASEKYKTQDLKEELKEAERQLGKNFAKRVVVVDNMITDRNEVLDPRTNKAGTETASVHPYVILRDGSPVVIHGRLSGNTVLLWEAAETGTIYHEAFHVVTQLYLTKKQRVALYNSVRNKDPKMRKLSDHQIEEHLAEGYREFVLSNPSTINRNKDNIILRFFKSLYNFIRGYVFNITNVYTDPTDLYNAIYNSKFKYNRPRDNADQTFYKKGAVFEYMGGTFKKLNTPAKIEKVAAMLSDIFTMFEAKGEPRAIVPSELILMLHDESQAYTAHISDRELNDIVANVEIFTKLIANLKHAAYNGSAQEADEQDGEWVEHDFNERGDRNHSQDNIKKSLLKSVDERIKAFVGLLPGFGADVATNPFVMTTTRVAKWARLLEVLHDSESPTDMLGRALAEADKKIDSNFWKTFYDQLSGMDANFITLMWQSVHTFKQHYIKIAHPSSKQYAAITTNEQSVAERMFYNASIAALPFSPLRAGTKQAIVIHDAVVSNVGSFNMLKDKESVERALLHFVADLRNLGMDFVSADLIKYVAKTKYPELGEQAQIAKFLTSSFMIKDYVKTVPSVIGNTEDHVFIDGKNVPIEKVGTHISIIRDLAKAEAERGGVYTSMTTLGANNNRYANYTLPTHLQQSFNELKDETHAEKLLNTTFARDSRWAKHVPRGTISNKIKVHTLLSYTNKQNEPLAPYELSPYDMWVMRLSLFTTNTKKQGHYQILPQMADYSTTYAVTGVPMTDVEVKNGGINTSVIDIFVSYLKTELATIKETHDTIQTVVFSKLAAAGVIGTDRVATEFTLEELQRMYDELTSEQKLKFPITELIKGYHYAKVGKQLVFTAANGLKLRYFSKLGLTVEELNKKATSDEALREQVSKLLTAVINDNIEAVVAAGIATKNTEQSTNGNKIGTYTVGDETVKIQYTIKDLKSLLVKASDSLDNLSDTDTLINAIANIAINQIVTGIEFDKTIAGDPAFYKNEDEKTSRSQRFMSSGRQIGFSKQDTHRVIHLSEFKKDSGVFAKSKMDQFVEYFEKLRERDPSVDVQEKVSAVIDAYSNIDMFDGGGFITLHAYMEIYRKLGMSNEYMEAAYKKAISGNLPAEEIRWIFQPLKLMVSNNKLKQVTPTTTLNVPYYTKPALFLVLPNDDLLTGEARRVADAMYKNNIGIAYTESAAKVGAHSLLDTSGDFETVIEEYVEDQSYTSLRHQLFTEHSVHQKRKLGIQILRLMFQHLDNDEEKYQLQDKELSGKEMYAKLISTINGLTKIGNEAALEELSLTKDDLRQFVSKMAAIASNEGDSTILQILFDKGNPINTNPNATIASQTALNKLLNVIDKLFISKNTFGTDAIQQVDFKGDLKFRNEDGMMEVAVSRFMLTALVPTWKKLTNQEINERLKTTKVTGLGYRIPTQGFGFSAAIRIKRVTPIAYGNVVTVPSEWVVQSGSDYDSDKIYMAMHGYAPPVFKGDDKAVLDLREDNGARAINTLIDIMQQVVLKESNAVSSLIPLTVITEPFENIITKYRDRNTNSMSRMSTAGEISYIYNIRSAATSLGAFALAFSSHNMLSNLDIHFDESSPHFTTLKHFELLNTDREVSIDGTLIADLFNFFINANVDVLKNPYIIYSNTGNKMLNTAVFLVRIGFGKTVLPYMMLPIMRSLQNTTIEKAINKLTTAVLDPNNDNIRNYLEIEVGTPIKKRQEVYDALIKILNTDGISYLNTENLESFLSGEQHTNLKNLKANFDEKTALILKNSKDLKKDLADNKELTDLANTIIATKIDMFLTEAIALVFYEQMEQPASVMSKLTRIANIDGSGNLASVPNIVYYLLSYDTLEGLTGLTNYKALFAKNNAFILDPVIRAISSAINSQAASGFTNLTKDAFFVYKQFASYLNDQYTNDARLLMQSMMNSVFMYYNREIVLQDLRTNKRSVQSLLYGEDSITNQYILLKAKYQFEGSMSNFLKLLSLHTDPKGVAYLQFNRGLILDKSASSAIMDAWDEFYNNANEDISKFARDLYIYFTLAFNDAATGRNEFVNYAPAAVINSFMMPEFGIDIPANRWLDERVKEANARLWSDTSVNENLIRAVLNGLADSSLGMHIEYKRGLPQPFGNKVLTSIDGKLGTPSMFVLKNDKKAPMLIHVDMDDTTLLYKKIGLVQNEKITHPVYELIPTNIIKAGTTTLRFNALHVDYEEQSYSIDKLLASPRLEDFVFTEFEDKDKIGTRDSYYEAINAAIPTHEVHSNAQLSFIPKYDKPALYTAIEARYGKGEYDVYVRLRSSFNNPLSEESIRRLVKSYQSGATVILHPDDTASNKVMSAIITGNDPFLQSEENATRLAEELGTYHATISALENSREELVNEIFQKLSDANLKTSTIEPNRDESTITSLAAAVRQLHKQDPNRKIMIVSDNIALLSQCEGALKNESGVIFRSYSSTQSTYGKVELLDVHNVIMVTETKETPFPYIDINRRKTTVPGVLRLRLITNEKEASKVKQGEVVNGVGILEYSSVENVMQDAVNHATIKNIPVVVSNSQSFTDTYTNRVRRKLFGVRAELGITIGDRIVTTSEYGTMPKGKSLIVQAVVGDARVPYSNDIGEQLNLRAFKILAIDAVSGVSEHMNIIAPQQSIPREAWLNAISYGAVVKYDYVINPDAAPAVSADIVYYLDTDTIDDIHAPRQLKIVKSLTNSLIVKNSRKAGSVRLKTEAPTLGSEAPVLTSQVLQDIQHKLPVQFIADTTNAAQETTQLDIKNIMTVKTGLQKIMNNRFKNGTLGHAAARIAKYADKLLPTKNIQAYSELFPVYQVQTSSVPGKGDVVLALMDRGHSIDAQTLNAEVIENIVVATMTGAIVIMPAVYDLNNSALTRRANMTDMVVTTTYLDSGEHVTIVYDRRMYSGIDGLQTSKPNSKIKVVSSISIPTIIQHEELINGIASGTVPLISLPDYVFNSKNIVEGSYIKLLSKNKNEKYPNVITVKVLGFVDLSYEDAFTSQLEIEVAEKYAQNYPNRRMIEIEVVSADGRLVNNEEIYGVWTTMHPSGIDINKLYELAASKDVSLSKVPIYNRSVINENVSIKTAIDESGLLSVESRYDMYRTELENLYKYNSAVNEVFSPYVESGERVIFTDQFADGIFSLAKVLADLHNSYITDKINRQYSVELYEDINPVLLSDKAFKDLVVAKAARGDYDSKVLSINGVYVDSYANPMEVKTAIDTWMRVVLDTKADRDNFKEQTINC